MGDTPDQFYDGADSLFVAAYDALYEPPPPQIAGDVAFYDDVARAAGGAVLELACGTGRVALPLAEGGLEVTGIDLSDGMLAVADRKAAALSAAARRRLTLIRQDMTKLDLDRRFGFAFVAFRSFQHLLTSDLQRTALTAIHRHLVPDGRLALHLFDPRLDLLVDAEMRLPTQSGRDEANGRRYVGEILQTRFDHLAQVRRDQWRYRETGPDGQVLREATRWMSLRWTYRWELHHLLARCGFAVDAEYSDFQRSAPAYGKELIVVGKAV